MILLLANDFDEIIFLGSCIAILVYFQVATLPATLP
jgi:hypothetical protein